jgi:hypothetical protein
VERARRGGGETPSVRVTWEMEQLLPQVCHTCKTCPGPHRRRGTLVRTSPVLFLLNSADSTNLIVLPKSSNEFFPFNIGSILGSQVHVSWVSLHVSPKYLSRS